MPTLFTPISAITGVVLIGLAACTLYVGIGRIARICGIIDRAIQARSERTWRIVFMLALMAGAALWLWTDEPRGAPGVVVTHPSLLLAGILVGVGTRLGNGCTSGHGVCGLARLSKRSLVAVVVFMGAAMATVYVMRHVAAAAT